MTEYKDIVRPQGTGAGADYTHFPTQSAVPAGFEGPAWFEDTGQMASYKGGVAVLENTIPLLPNVYPKKIKALLTPPTPYPGVGNGALVHPMLAYSKKSFAGYKYWLTFTPYPDNNSAYENPCVVASNDLVTWVSLATNPLIVKPATGYNADVHITFNSDESILYLVFRERLTGTNNSLKMMHTTDGYTWSEPVTIKSGATGSEDYACPSLMYNKHTDKWLIITHDLDDVAGGKPVRLMTSATSDPYSTWSAPVDLTVPVTPLNAVWHSGWAMTESGQLVGVGQENLIASGGGEGKAYLWYGLSGTVYKKQTIDFPVLSYRAALVMIEGTPHMLNSHLGGKSFELISLASFDEYLAITASYAEFKTLTKKPLVLDNFTRVDGVVATSDTEQAWIGTPTLSVVSNRAVATNGTSAKTYVVTGCYDVEAILDIQTKAVSETYIILRVVDANNYIRVGFRTGNTINIDEIKSGSLAQQIPLSAPTNASDIGLLSVKLIGQYICVSVNGCVIYEGYWPLFSTVNGTGYGISVVDTGSAFKARSFLVVGPNDAA